MSQTCSTVSRDSGEDLAATASAAASVLVLDHPGPWGRQALRDSDLPDGLGELLSAGSAGTGTQILLARRPGRPIRDVPRDSFRFWLAHTSPGGTRMRNGELTVDQLRRADFTAIGRGELPAWGHVTTEPVLVVCTNGKRDACCAVYGREIITALTSDPRYADVADAVLESSHLGGHRFAATSLLLPSGLMHGRLDPQTAAEVLRAARVGRVMSVGYRGRTTWRPALQAAEIAVRDQEAIDGLDVLDVLRVVTRADGTAVGLPCTVADPQAETLDRLVTEVRHRDGRTWQVEVAAEVRTGAVVSCGTSPEAVTRWQVTALRPSDPWIT